MRTWENLYWEQPPDVFAKQKSLTYRKSGALDLIGFDFVTGVGTAIITKSASFILDGSVVNSMLALVLLLLPKFIVFSSSMSNPITFRCFEKASANGKPT